MPRTNYRSQTTFTVPSQGSVSLPPLRPPSPNHEVYITFPISSKIATGLHWHETHTEYLQIIQGVALVTLGDSTERYTAKSGVITIPRYTVHESRHVDLIVKEWTDPADGEKAIFFRNVVGLILDRDPAARTLQNLRTAWNLFVVFWEWDNFPRFVKMPRLWGLGNSVERGVTWAILGSAALIGRWVGVRGTYEEYGTKDDLRP
ncbi:uncharacterized protein K444DRAFT_588701 [Hyaloscypha bicolor E]|uniref:Cupin 2 conserved barrel domain-containing protein n=1 Tax=Hyaloscypha bicolor E TaxID=1095630 RepID=A0A2J6TCE6_9HELO|nr:uncharacterized protein K444DRAFT_588701 [Hyaloscypha bicolor E]PMD60695.1 hypothetical protein K444DRAFT_588701 [Hyaloscypha bicolor E]